MYIQYIFYMVTIERKLRYTKPTHCTDFSDSCLRWYSLNVKKLRAVRYIILFNMGTWRLSYRFFPFFADVLTMFLNEYVSMWVIVTSVKYWLLACQPAATSLIQFSNQVSDLQLKKLIDRFSGKGSNIPSIESFSFLSSRCISEFLNFQHILNSPSCFHLVDGP